MMNAEPLIVLRLLEEELAVCSQFPEMAAIIERQIFDIRKRGERERAAAASLCTSLFNELQAEDLTSTVRYMIVVENPDGLFRRLEQACNKAGNSNTLSQAQRILQEAERLRQLAKNVKAPPQSTGLPRRQVCANAYSETAWCRSTGAMSSMVGCIEGPVQTGSYNPANGLYNYSVGLKLHCSAKYYLAVVEYIDVTGECSREVLRLSPKSRTSVNVPGDGGWAHIESNSRPKVLDAIAAVPSSFMPDKSTAEIEACYRRRHQGCACR